MPLSVELSKEIETGTFNVRFPNFNIMQRNQRHNKNVHEETLKKRQRGTVKIFP